MEGPTDLVARSGVQLLRLTVRSQEETAIYCDPIETTGGGGGVHVSALPALSMLKLRASLAVRQTLRRRRCLPHRWYDPIGGSQQSGFTLVIPGHLNTLGRAEFPIRESRKL